MVVRRARDKVVGYSRKKITVLVLQRRGEGATIHGQTQTHRDTHTYACTHTQHCEYKRRREETGGRGRSFSELGWPPPMQLANSRTRRVNCTTTYVPRRRRNAATMMPSSHEITRDMSRHDIPLTGDPAGTRARGPASIVYAHGGKNHLILDDRSAQERGSRHSFTCAAASIALSPRLYRPRCRFSPAIRIDLLFLVNLDRLRIDDSPKEPALLHLDRSILSFFFLLREPIRLHSNGG